MKAKKSFIFFLAMVTKNEKLAMVTKNENLKRGRLRLHLFIFYRCYLYLGMGMKKVFTLKTLSEFSFCFNRYQDQWYLLHAFYCFILLKRKRALLFCRMKTLLRKPDILKSLGLLPTDIIPSCLHFSSSFFSFIFLYSIFHLIFWFFSFPRRKSGQNIIIMRLIMTWL